jgi:hypothetical protein
MVVVGDKPNVLLLQGRSITVTRCSLAYTLRVWGCQHRYGGRRGSLLSRSINGCLRVLSDGAIVGVRGLWCNTCTRSMGRGVLLVY